MFAPRGVTVLARTHPYDHCNFTVTSASPQKLVDRFKQLLLGMSYEDPEARPLLDLEGLRRWVPGRTEGYWQLEAAVEATGFYDQSGEVTVPRYSN